MEPLSQVVGYPAVQVVLGSIPLMLAIAGASRQNGRYLIAIENRIDGLDKRIDKVDERLSRIETKLDNSLRPFMILTKGSPS